MGGAEPGGKLRGNCGRRRDGGVEVRYRLVPEEARLGRTLPGKLRDIHVKRCKDAVCLGGDGGITHTVGQTHVAFVAATKRSLGR